MNYSILRFILTLDKFLIGCGGRFEREFQVMSLTSYQTAPPRAVIRLCF